MGANTQVDIRNALVHTCGNVEGRDSKVVVVGATGGGGDVGWYGRVTIIPPSKLIIPTETHFKTIIPELGGGGLLRCA